MPLAFETGVTTLGTLVLDNPNMTLPFNPDMTVPNDEQVLRPGAREAYPSTALRAGAEVQPRRGLSLRGLLDTGEIRPGSSLDPEVDGPTSYGLPLGEAATEGLFVREAAVAFYGRRWGVDLGRFDVGVGEGLIYNDFGTGGSVSLDLARVDGDALRLDVDGVLVGRSFSELRGRSSFWAARLELPLSRFEHLSPFVAYYADRDGALRDVMVSALAESYTNDNGSELALDLLHNAAGQLSIHGDLLYLGADTLVLPIDGMSLRATGAVQAGRLRLALPDRSEDTLRVRGAGAQVEAHYGIGSRWDLGALGFGLSGDRAPQLDREDPRYAAFIAPAPLWAWTGLFFNGGLGQGFYPSRASAAGVNGHGVLGAGPVVSWQGDRPSVEMRAIWLRAVADSPAFGGGGATYGVEVDLRNDWRLSDWATLAGELDMLFPGSYFPEDDVALQFILLLDLHHEG